MYIYIYIRPTSDLQIQGCTLCRSFEFGLAHLKKGLAQISISRYQDVGHLKIGLIPLPITKYQDALLHEYSYELLHPN